MIDPNEPAFAIPESNCQCFSPGLSIRAYMATHIASGMLAADAHGYPRWSPESALAHPGGGKWLEPDGLANQAVLITDALIARLNAPEAEWKELTQ